MTSASHVDFGALDLASFDLVRAIARCRSFTGAARELGYSQSAASQRVRRLERAVGVPLFVRTNSGVRPTDAGAILIERAADAIAVVEMARQEIESLRNLRSGRVRVSAFPSVSTTILPTAIAELRRRHPDVEVQFRQHEPGRHLSCVVDGSADISVVYSYDGRVEREATSSSLDDQLLLMDRLDVALHTRHPLAWRSSVDLADLADEVWLVGFHSSLLQSRAREAGFVPRLGHEVTDYGAAQAFVAADLGVAIMPKLVQHSFRHPGVEFRELRPHLSRAVHMVTRTSSREIPAVQALRHELLAAAQAFGNE